MADDSPGPVIKPDVWHSELQIYVNMCVKDADIFDFGVAYGVINRQKGIKAKSLMSLHSLVDRLLAISPSGKIRKPELASAVSHIIDENKHRQIIPCRTRDDACRYVVSQALPRLLF